MWPGLLGAEQGAPVGPPIHWREEQEIACRVDPPLWWANLVWPLVSSPALRVQITVLQSGGFVTDVWLSSGSGGAAEPEHPQPEGLLCLRRGVCEGRRIVSVCRVDTNWGRKRGLAAPARPAHLWLEGAKVWSLKPPQCPWTTWMKQVLCNYSVFGVLRRV